MPQDSPFSRSSGILLHVTSLPGRYGIGDFGEGARQFLRCLREAGQTYWQILPLGPTGFADSPYQCLSSFAGNTTLISLDGLVEMGLLTQDDLDAGPCFRARYVDYGPVIRWHDEMLSLAYERFVARGGPRREPGYEEFCERNRDWLDDFVLFAALKDVHDRRPWWEWPGGEAFYGKAAIAAARRKHARLIAEHRFRQWLFDMQWRELKRFASEECHIQIVGDIPIYVARDSCDVWADQQLFELDENGNPVAVAGVPPDYFSATGQLWGNPLYRWDEHKQTGYAWWLRRIRRTLEMVDVVRIDHFRGFYNYWRVPAGEDTARNGQWVDGPRDDFFDGLGEDIQRCIIAEDLGDAMGPVLAWREALGLPGMKILQFAFGGNEDEQSRFTPEKYGGNNDELSIIYTGTHDNNTAIGWWVRDATDSQRKHLLKFARKWRDDPEYEITEPNWELIEIGMQSRTLVFIVPLQDVLGAGSNARMNTPARESGNWAWRCTESELSWGQAGGISPWRRLADLTWQSNRWNPANHAG